MNVPLGNGDVYGPKLNSLLSYAERHPDEFPDGGLRTLEDAVGALLGIPISYYAKLDFAGFVDMVDAVGGVDIKVKKTLKDPSYDGYGLGEKGFTLKKGTHHLNGAEALAYARIRKAVGESDFTRADRQQQILVALKEQATSGGSILWELPGLMEAVGETITLRHPRVPAPGPRGDHGRDGAQGGHPGRHQPPARRHEADSLRRLAGPRREGDPGDGGRAVLRAGHQARAVADAQADART